MTCFLTFTTCRRLSFDLFIYTAVMMGTDTFSFSLYYFHFITLLKIDHRGREKEEEERREKRENDRVNVKNANQAKSVCVRCGTFALHV
jgi:hypothetical protein